MSPVRAEGTLPEHAVLHKAWTRFLQHALDQSAGGVLRAPPRIPDVVLSRSGYLEHFPHQILSVPRRGTGLGESLTPAACLHVYPRLQGTETAFYATWICGECTRFEGGKWEAPYRLKTFHMLEFVSVGKPDAVQTARTRLTAALEEAFAQLRLGGRMHNATDAFFLGQNEGARLMQQLKGLKKEYRVQDSEASVALASVNYHEDHFARRFDIRADGAPAHSFCAAFGLDRLTTFGLRTWGPDPSRWPHALAQYAAIP